MKRIILLLCMFFIAFMSYANDTLIQKSVGGNEYVISKSNTISIESEILKIDLFEDFFKVSVDYIFRNDGESAILDVGFPQIEYQRITEDINESQKIRDFITTVDGVIQKIEIEKSDILLNTNRTNERIKKFYKKTVNFPENKKINICVEYTASYDFNTDGLGTYLVEYLLGSAISWNKIESLMLIINIHSDKLFLIREFDDIQNNKPNKITVYTLNDIRSIEQQYTNINLEFNTKMRLYVDDGNGIFGIPWDYNYEIKTYPRTDFELLTKSQLRLSRNLIYAYHGYKFQSKELLDRFQEFMFYEIDDNFSEELFTDNEKANLDMIISVENGK